MCNSSNTRALYSRQGWALTKRLGNQSAESNNLESSASKWALLCMRQSAQAIDLTECHLMEDVDS